MNSSIQEFMLLLADNEFRPKYKDIPEEFDNRDEMLAEIHDILDDGGLLPDYLRYFELNGVETSTELKSRLQTAFQQFRIEYLKGNFFDNALFKSELIKQLDECSSDVEQVISESLILKDKALLDMLKAKAAICQEVKAFIQQEQKALISLILEKNIEERSSFVWLKEKELIDDFYNHLKNEKLIAQDTNIDDFRAVFSNIPVSKLHKPVQWEKGAKLFAYFFHKLLTNKFIPQKPSWVILPYCFTYNRNDVGKNVAVKETIKSHVPSFSQPCAPKGAEIIDPLFS